MVDFIQSLFERWGDEAYLGESVTQAEHMLQAAQLAEQAGASDAEVAAALLHDLGHALVAAQGMEDTADRHHETVAADFLQGAFAPRVLAPIRWHVAAKRYLCAVEPEYFASLSDASVHSLGLQGGPMNDDEVRAFEGLPVWQSCVRVRRWDDQAKVVELPTPGFHHYRPLLERLVMQPR